MALLTSKQKSQLPQKAFAEPPTPSAKARGMKGSYVISDKSHARNALSRVAQFGSPGQIAAVRSKVSSKFPGIGKKAKS